MCKKRRPLIHNQTREFSLTIEENQIDLVNLKYPSNFIISSHYTLINFLPLSFFLQFKRYANIYFLIVAVFQSIPSISPLNPISAIAPLVFVLGLSMMREGAEDYYRYKSDIKINSNQTNQLFLKENIFVEQKIKWANVQVGQILKIYNDQCFPADLLLLDTSYKNGICYVETGALDGEKNMKPKSALRETYALFKNDLVDQIKNIQINAEPPNQNLYKFEVTIKVLASTKQLLLRGAFLRNTDYILGVVVYTGKDTKIMRNSELPKNKISDMEKTMNTYILGILIFQLISSFFTAILSYFSNCNYMDDQLYLNFTSSYVLDCLLKFFTYFLLYNTMIPISLIVSLEMVKVTQGYFIQKDKEMYCKQKDIWPQVMTTTINEELGQIEYVFSDKTGTLTCNEMEFNKSVIGTELYQGQIEKMNVKFKFHSQSLSNLLKLNNPHNNYDVNLNLVSNDNKVKFTIKSQKDLAFEYWKLLSCAHECIISENKETGDIDYQGPSPDEITLVDAARHMGFKFTGASSDTIDVNINENKCTFQLLNTFEFDSTRKRMSVIIKDGNLYKMYIKGADNIIKKRLSGQKPQPFLKTIENHLSKFSIVGLRTLMMAMKIISEDEYLSFKSKYNSFADSKNREEDVKKLADEIENDLILIGATAVEDKLQDRVTETIYDMIKANIKVWMLTGDKLETAENIAKSCKLIQSQMKVIQISEQNEIDLKNNILGNAMQQFQECMQSKIQKSLLVEGESLAIILDDETLKQAFLKISQDCESVVCCRVTPKQKALIVRLIKDGIKKITLAIGDGANDVNMIQEAHIGCGIFGNEGMQAAQSSDFAFGEFKCLWRLILVHGRWSYIRISEMILYFFYKNMLFTIPQMYFAFFSGFSGQTIFDDVYITLYNLSFTALPLIARAVFDQDVNYKVNVDQIIKGQKNNEINKINIQKEVYAAKQKDL
ncbi:phospholipid-translocating p-type flippase family protein, putative [Ichthyophthirius multifiliis]|uniref:Phospholipid-transporting ATPase n=1 Tax=Ichthyophthirius multifiliis TaxID=5932 RepID=G0R497_ICHMU|nr:phospholipid-translocating p-type flippase family protein, putative [Ichthyophthirius multifiliis]EGR27708.1 phospholipid-translocating p-type flippase family protein, putative [Ichthyophthirius multifiliis]|eukprot:XP_004025160.1 phospholipid-translocating p-type flippase family protein, putative [Ichthyophthirius multifiliis]